MIKIVTDSTCCLPKSVLNHYAITQIPVSIRIDGQTYLDQVELSSTEFYEKLTQTSRLPTTNQPSVDDFKTLYTKILDESPGATILSLHLSGTLSGTVASAQMAAKAMDQAHIHVVDTRSFAMGHGLMARHAAHLAAEGQSLESVLAGIRSVRDTLAGFLILDTVEYIMKSGRLGRVRGTLARAMDIKPMITLREGEVEAYGRFRSREEALVELARIAIEAGTDVSDFQLGVMHANAPEDAARLAAQLDGALHPKALVIGEISGAIGSGIGPAAIGASWCSPT